MKKLYAIGVSMLLMLGVLTSGSLALAESATDDPTPMRSVYYGFQMRLRMLMAEHLSVVVGSYIQTIENKLEAEKDNLNEADVQAVSNMLIDARAEYDSGTADMSAENYSEATLHFLGARELAIKADIKLQVAVAMAQQEDEDEDKDEDDDEDKDEDDDEDDEDEDDRGGKVRDDNVVICKVPRGNAKAAHTITISKSALATHLRLGAKLGACPVDNGDEDDATEDVDKKNGLAEKLGPYERLKINAQSGLRFRLNR